MPDTRIHISMKSAMREIIEAMDRLSWSDFRNLEDDLPRIYAHCFLKRQLAADAEFPEREGSIAT